MDLKHLGLPSPMIEITIEPKDKGDQSKMKKALERLVKFDPSFGFAINHETGHAVIKGTDEQHLDMKIEVLRSTYKVDVNVGAPQVAYRETITRKATVDYTFKKQFDAGAHFARVVIEFEPRETGKGYEFENRIVSGSLPKKYIPGVQKGLEYYKETGVVAGFPTIDFKATLLDGAYHDTDSSPLAFAIAAREAFKEGMLKAGPVLLEPIMKVEVVTPEEFSGSVIGDLNIRRGQILGMDERGSAKSIDARVPLATMFGYVNTLRSMTQGHATYTMQFDHYEQVPPYSDSPDDKFPAATAMRETKSVFQEKTTADRRGHPMLRALSWRRRRR
jgi:elongation factor G